MGHSVKGHGGSSIYVQGTVGGLMTPLGITITDFDGNDYREYTLNEMIFWYMMADHAMDAIENGDESQERPYLIWIFLLPKSISKYL